VDDDPPPLDRPSVRHRRSISPPGPYFQVLGQGRLGGAVRTRIR
jgi:hypothetical protein